MPASGVLVSKMIGTEWIRRGSIIDIKMGSCGVMNVNEHQSFWKNAARNRAYSSGEIKQDPRNTYFL